MECDKSHKRNQLGLVFLNDYILRTLIYENRTDLYRLFSSGSLLYRI